MTLKENRAASLSCILLPVPRQPPCKQRGLSPAAGGERRQPGPRYFTTHFTPKRIFHDDTSRSAEADARSLAALGKDPGGHGGLRRGPSVLVAMPRLSWGLVGHHARPEPALKPTAPSFGAHSHKARANPLEHVCKVYMCIDIDQPSELLPRVYSPTQLSPQRGARSALRRRADTRPREPAAARKLHGGGRVGAVGPVPGRSGDPRGEGGREAGGGLGSALTSPRGRGEAAAARGAQDGGSGG